MRLILPIFSGRPVLIFITRFFVGVQGMLNRWEVFMFIDELKYEIVLVDRNQLKNKSNRINIRLVNNISSIEYLHLLVGEASKLDLLRVVLAFILAFIF